MCKGLRVHQTVHCACVRLLSMQKTLSARNYSCPVTPNISRENMLCDTASAGKNVTARTCACSVCKEPHSVLDYS